MTAAVELPGPVAFVDGECNVCDWWMRYLLDHDTRRELHYASLQGETAAALAAVVRDFPTDVSTLVVAEPDGGGVRLWLRTGAIRRALELTGGSPWLLRFLRVTPKPLREVFYWVFRRARYRLFGRKDECRLPTPDERSLLLP